MSLQTLPQYLLDNARRQPQQIGERHKRDGIWQEYSWSAIAAEVKGIACGLLALEVQRGDTVLLLSENRPELYWAQLAAMAIGAKTVALYPDATAEELAYIAADSGAVVLFAEDQEQVDKALAIVPGQPGLRRIAYWEPGGLWAYAARHGSLLCSLDRLKEEGSPRAAADPEEFERGVAAGSADDIALLTYTSGTTGQPKGVIITYGALLDGAERIRQSFALRPGMDYLSYISLSWLTEQWIGVGLGLMVPLCVNFAERPDQVQEAIRELAVEMLVFGPRQWESLAAKVHARMLDTSPRRQRLVDWGLSVGRAVNVARLEGRTPPLLPRLLYALADLLVLRPLRDQLGLVRTGVALSGGSATAPDVFRLFASMGVALRNIYGCSEYGVISAHLGACYDAETTGRPITAATPWRPALAWRLSPSAELQLAGGVGFAGYWNKPDKTAERFDGDWYRTGDSVGLSADGQFIYYDRVDHLSQLADGSKYPKQFIEVRLRFSPYIKDVMVIGDERHAHVSALINIDYEIFSRWAEQRRIGFTTFTDLSQRPEVIACVAAEITRVNRALPAQAQVLRFANLPKELDPDEGELTRTRKLRREFIAERYADIITALYADTAQVDVAIPVRYQDGRRGSLKATVRLADCAAGAGKSIP